MPRIRASSDEEATGLARKPNHDNRVTSVVPVVSPVVVGVCRGDGRYCDQRGKKENQDLFHFCSSNSALTELSRDFHSGFPFQPFKALLAAFGLFTIAHSGKDAGALRLNLSQRGMANFALEDDCWSIRRCPAQTTQNWLICRCRSLMSSLNHHVLGQLQRRIASSATGNHNARLLPLIRLKISMMTATTIKR